MAPIQRTVTALETTVETSSFEAGLASHVSPGFLKALVHDRSDAGAGGVIGGLLTPVSGLPRQNSSGPELPMRAQRRMRVQRRTAEPVLATVEETPGDLTEPGEVPTVPRALDPLPPAQVADRPAVQLTRSTASADAPPALYLSPVAAAVESPVASPIISSPAGAGPEVPSDESAAEPEKFLPAPASPGTAVEAPSAADVAAADPPVTPAPAMQRLPIVDLNTEMPVPQVTADRPRRLGLGEPLHRVPGPVTLQRRSDPEKAEAAPSSASPPLPGSSLPSTTPHQAGAQNHPSTGPVPPVPADVHTAAGIHSDAPSTGTVMVSLLAEHPRVTAVEPAPESGEQAGPTGPSLPMALHHADVPPSTLNEAPAPPAEAPATRREVATAGEAPDAGSARPTLGAVQLVRNSHAGPPGPAPASRPLAAPASSPGPMSAQRSVAAPASSPGPMSAQRSVAAPASSPAPMSAQRSVAAPAGPPALLDASKYHSPPSAAGPPMTLEKASESQGTSTSGERDDPPAPSTGLTSAAAITVQTVIAPLRASATDLPYPQPLLPLQRTAVQRSAPALEAPVVQSLERPGLGALPSLTVPAPRQTSGPVGDAPPAGPAVDEIVNATSRTTVIASGPRPAVPLLALQPLALATVRAAPHLPAHAPTAPMTAPVAVAEPVQRTSVQPAAAPRAPRLELAAPSPPTGSPAPAWADPAAAAVASGLATRAPDGSVVFTAPPDDLTVQRQAEASAAPPAAPAAVPATGAAPAGGAQTNDQMDELAKRVYDTIRQRLKAELRLDRERSGRLTDLSR